MATELKVVHAETEVDVVWTQGEDETGEASEKDTASQQVSGKSKRRITETWNEVLTWALIEHARACLQRGNIRTK